MDTSFSKVHKEEKIIMANFSKEYVEKYFPEWCYDFSVNEMFNEI